MNTRGYKSGDCVKTLGHGVGVIVGINRCPARSRTWRAPSYAVRIDGLGYFVAYYETELQLIEQSSTMQSADWRCGSLSGKP